MAAIVIPQTGQSLVYPASILQMAGSDTPLYQAAARRQSIRDHWQTANHL